MTSVYRRWTRFLAVILATGVTVFIAQTPTWAGAGPEDSAVNQTLHCETKTEALLQRMTPEEKIGQMVMALPHDDPHGMPDEQTRKAIQQYHVGSFILYHRNDPGSATRYNNRLQRWAADTRLGIPLLLSADFEYGTLQHVRRGTTGFPRPMGIGATRSLKETAVAARITAREARAMGFHWNYAPLADVNTRPENPVIGVRSFGEKTRLVSDMTAAFVRATQKERVIATPKHFPGHGDTDTDSHLDLPVVTYDRETLEKVHLPPFRAAIDAGADAVMTAHVVVRAIDPHLPATLSPQVLTGLLREEMGFEGIIVTDSMSMDAIDEHWGTAEAAVMSVKAGADIVMSTGSDGTFADLMETVEGLREAYRSGELSEKRIDQSVRRILRTKCEYGLFEDRIQSPKKAEHISGHPSHLKQASRIIRHSITLVKNDDVLPWDPGDGGTILVTGVHRAEELGAEMDRISSAQFIIRETETDRPTDGEIEEIVRMAKKADRVIVTTYSKDRLPPEQKKLVASLMKADKPLVAVSLGLPYDLKEYPQVPAYLATYAMDPWPGFTPDPPVLTEVAKVVFGAEPGGRLPVTISEEYPYGHGISYGH